MVRLGDGLSYRDTEYLIAFNIICEATRRHHRMVGPCRWLATGVPDVIRGLQAGRIRAESVAFKTPNVAVLDPYPVVGFKRR